MLERMAPRGPDARGEYDVPGTLLRLGHLRLSILDLDERSNQPFTSACGRYALTFNGEIYNYVELRLALVAEGVRFATTSDTEVLLQLLIRHGAKALDMLDGMFAFAFVDARERKLLLARDPLGEKPLYYSIGGGSRPYTFAFASEIKGLLAVEGVDTALDGEALRDYLRFLYTAAPRTMYRGIRELAPGHLLEIRLDSPADGQHAWYDLEQRSAAPFEGSYEDAVAQLRAVAVESLRLRLRSDVPVGFYLSGGMDSNILLGLARSASPEQALETYTIRYGGSQLARSSDESDLAARGAAYRGAQNLAIDFSQDESLLVAAERMNAIFDQPFGNATAIVAEQLAKIAARRHKVCLVGDGGDELAAGYPRYRALMMYGACVARRIAAAARRAQRDGAPGRARPIRDVLAACADVRGRSRPADRRVLPRLVDLCDRNRRDPRARPRKRAHGFLARDARTVPAQCVRSVARRGAGGLPLVRPLQPDAIGRPHGYGELARAAQSLSVDAPGRAQPALAARTQAPRRPRQTAVPGRLQERTAALPRAPTQETVQPADAHAREGAAGFHRTLLAGARIAPPRPCVARIPAPRDRGVRQRAQGELDAALRPGRARALARASCGRRIRFRSRRTVRRVAGP